MAEKVIGRELEVGIGEELMTEALVQGLEERVKPMRVRGEGKTPVKFPWKLNPIVVEEGVMNWMLVLVEAGMAWQRAPGTGQM